MDDPPPLRDPSYTSWSQSNSAIITWLLHIIEHSIAKSLARIKPARSLWQTHETMYANQMNIGRVVEIFETLLTLKQGDLSLQAHFGRLQVLIQEVDLYQPPTTNLLMLKHFASIDASSSASLASLPAPSTSGTFALLTSSSRSWIIDSGASDNMLIRHDNT